MKVDLRRERERRGLSLDEVSARARIPRAWLDALETGDTSSLPRGPFLESYQRQYLAFLDLPPDTPVAPPRPAPIAPSAEPAAARAAGPVTLPPGPRTPPPGPAALPDEPTLDADELARTRTITRQYDNVPVVRLVLAGFLATMALVLAMKLLSGLVDRAAEGAAAPALAQAAPDEAATDEATPAQAAPDEVAPDEAATVEAATVEAAAVEAATAEAAADEAATDGTAAPTPDMRIHLRASERVRVAVDLDGTTAFSGWLEAGERHDFHGSERVAIEVSDLTRLAIAYNGDKVEPLGNLSHPRRLVFVRDGG